MSPEKIIQWALQAVEIALALLKPDEQARLQKRLEQTLAAKQRVRVSAQAALDRRRARK